MTRLRWQRVSGKPTLNIRDEEDFRSKDGAARWLEKRARETRLMLIRRSRHEKAKRKK